MGKYILRRILYAIPIAFGVSVVCFSLVYIAPGDPLQTVLPPDATAETVAIVKHAYGFDKPLPVQFLIWLGRVVTGDFGVSIATRRPVFLEVSDALSNTALLALFAVPIAFFIGYAMGAVAGSFAGRWIDRVVTGAAVVGVSLPNYWLGIVLVIVFAVEYMVLPATGMGPNGSTGFDLLQWSNARFLVLPVITLAMIPIGILARTTRAAVAEVRNQDFVQTLRAKGLSEWAVTRHVLKNAMPQVMAVMGVRRDKAALSSGCKPHPAIRSSRKQPEQGARVLSPRAREAQILWFVASQGFLRRFHRRMCKTGFARRALTGNGMRCARRGTN